MPLEVGKMYVVDDDFHAEGEGELTVLKGHHVTVLEAEDPNNPGWIFVQLGDQSGFVPSDFLVESDVQSTGASSAGRAPPPPIGSGVNYGSFNSMSGGAPAPYGDGHPSAHHQQDQMQSHAPAPYGDGHTTAYDYQPPQNMASSTSPPPPPPPINPNYGGYHQQSYTSQNSSSAYSGYSSQDYPYGQPQQPPQPPQVDAQAAERAVVQNEAKFKADQRLISIDLWKYREELLGGRIDPPQPPSRRWFYRDYFGDQQGPFNSSEMKDRLHRTYIKDDSRVLMETGFGEHAGFEEEILRDLFRSPEAAFVEAPRLTRRGGSHWFFVGAEGEETGPFTTPQMLAWYQAGYMGGELLVRLANGKSTMTPLKDVYPDPQNAFRAPPMLPGFDPNAFQGERTVVLTPAPRRNHERSPDPNMERVEIGEPEPPQFTRSSSTGSNIQGKSKTKAKVPKITYGDGFAPEFTGTPSPANLKPSVYSSMLYTFVTRPLHPDAGTVQCYIRRDIDGSHVNFNVYRLFLEDSNTPILAAFRHHHTVHTFFDIKLNTTGKLQGNTAGLTIAHLELNFGGTSFLCHNNVAGHQGAAKDLVACTYEKNRVSSKGPRKMKVAIPGITDDAQFAAWKHDGGVKQSPMLLALKSISTKDLVVMINKPPTFNKAKGAYQLNFGGRVTRSSVKNFQLVDSLRDPDHKRIILQHGRVGVNKFTMDVQHPMSLLQGFATALSSLHTKKSVN
mmetsp:Transcript_8098/g.16109  ORF Transcript_8098/g.16109 Transcript_8098/m.16109 type:complete len:728 (+) Transcript_8098:716-2899(+)|eukprot:CAMPEP_0171491984 /NCGR_PEP_ID=MMETSP0958-20121227/4160_1 /TAXON_ID=87120 /ORGANISM="Aurantiochytrium limacinum, Strain ATCCMYA-1381" /LENGTH=727 /DNA_ID=CAMNT_0012025457 /DNA_START=691 /DNA_END=2877 /DNA_ORIENTATION=-